jgi:hypothetical protein
MLSRFQKRLWPLKMFMKFINLFAIFKICSRSSKSVRKIKILLGFKNFREP